MPFQLPTPDPAATCLLGAFRIERDGSLHPRSAARRPALRFAWRGRLCEAEVAEGALRLGSDAACIPFTVEAAEARGGAFAALAALPASLPAGWRASLLPDHRIRLEAEAALASPATVCGLLAALVRFALALDPYLDRLEAAGACPRGAGRS